MKQITCWKGGHRRLSLLVSAGVALGLASWTYGQCKNACGAGDVAEGEACLVDLDEDTTNTGCNAAKGDPVVFGPGNCSVTICGTGSTYRVDTDDDGIPDTDSRDTDWYLVDAATLAAADADGNGVMQIRSTVTSEFPGVTFIITLGDPICDDVSVAGVTGFSAPDCAGGEPAELTVILAENPNGIVVFVSTGETDGTPIRTGFACDVGATDYILQIECLDEFPTACEPGAGPCNEPNGTPGCEDPACCDMVCDIDPLCCITPWTQGCADIAIDTVGCAVGQGAPDFLATGPDSGQDGYLDLFVDGMGSEADGGGFGQGPDWVDQYNPVGGNLQVIGFSNTTFLYTDTARIALSLHEAISDPFDGVWPAENLSAEITAANVVTDENMDGVNDQQVSQFSVAGDLSLDVTLTQRVESFLALGGTPAATWTLTYDITNTGGASSTFRIVRWDDIDYGGGAGFGDDIVGTGTNAGVKCDRYVYQGEDGLPNLSVTLSTNQPDAAYAGSKNTVNPDKGDPDCPAFGFGTDTQVWNNFGFPACYVNHIANVGTDTDGESGQTPGSDGSIGLQSTISLEPGAMTTVVYKFTYGAITPDGADCGGGVPCPADIVVDGDVGVKDLLFLLGAWGECPAKGECPADLVVDGDVGVKDLLFLLGAWGPCPL